MLKDIKSRLVFAVFVIALLVFIGYEQGKRSSCERDFLIGETVAEKVTKEVAISEGALNRKVDTDEVKIWPTQKDLPLLIKHLPRFDCGACGFPTCRAFAEAVIEKKASYRGCFIDMRRGGRFVRWFEEKWLKNAKGEKAFKKAK